MEKHDNTMDENKRRESMEFEKSVAIGIQDNTCGYNDEFWD